MYWSSSWSKISESPLSELQRISLFIGLRDWLPIEAARSVGTAFCHRVRFSSMVGCKGTRCAVPSSTTVGTWQLVCTRRDSRGERSRDPTKLRLKGERIFSTIVMLEGSIAAVGSLKGKYQNLTCSFFFTVQLHGNSLHAVFWLMEFIDCMHEQRFSASWTHFTSTIEREGIIRT